MAKRPILQLADDRDSEQSQAKQNSSAGTDTFNNLTPELTTAQSTSDDFLGQDEFVNSFLNQAITSPTNKFDSSFTKTESTAKVNNFAQLDDANPFADLEQGASSRSSFTTKASSSKATSTKISINFTPSSASSSETSQSFNSNTLSLRGLTTKNSASQDTSTNSSSKLQLTFSNTPTTKTSSTSPISSIFQKPSQQEFTSFKFGAKANQGKSVFGNNDDDDSPDSLPDTDNIDTGADIPLAEKVILFFELLVKINPSIIKREEQLELAQSIAQILDANSQYNLTRKYNFTAYGESLQGISKHKFLNSKKFFEEDLKVLVREAPTGTGKSLAYLIPVILSKQKTIISTFLKTLQEQLMVDMPKIINLCNQINAFTKKHSIDFVVPIKDFNFHLLKGQSNYICVRNVAYLDAILHNRIMHKYDEKANHKNSPDAKKTKEIMSSLVNSGFNLDEQSIFDASASSNKILLDHYSHTIQRSGSMSIVKLHSLVSDTALGGKRDVEFKNFAIKKLKEWIKANDHNPDRLDIENLPQDIYLTTENRNFVTLYPNECPRNSCAYAKTCPYLVSRKKAKLAQVLMVNHNTLISLANTPEISNRESIIIDEAHNLPKVLIDNNSITIATSNTKKFLQDLSRFTFNQSASSSINDFFKLDFEGNAEGVAYHLATTQQKYQQQFDELVDSDRLQQTYTSDYAQALLSLQPDRDYLAIDREQAVAVDFLYQKYHLDSKSSLIDFNVARTVSKVGLDLLTNLNKVKLHPGFWLNRIYYLDSNTLANLQKFRDKSLYKSNTNQVVAPALPVFNTDLRLLLAKPYARVVNNAEINYLTTRYRLSPGRNLFASNFNEIINTYIVHKKASDKTNDKASDKLNTNTNSPLDLVENPLATSTSTTSVATTDSPKSKNRRKKDTNPQVTGLGFGGTELQDASEIEGFTSLELDADYDDSVNDELTRTINNLARNKDSKAPVSFAVSFKTKYEQQLGNFAFQQLDLEQLSLTKTDKSIARPYLTSADLQELAQSQVQAEDFTAQATNTEGIQVEQACDLGFKSGNSYSLNDLAQADSLAQFRQDYIETYHSDTLDDDLNKIDPKDSYQAELTKYYNYNLALPDQGQEQITLEQFELAFLKAICANQLLVQAQNQTTSTSPNLDLASAISQYTVFSQTQANHLKVTAPESELTSIFKSSSKTKVFPKQTTGFEEGRTTIHINTLDFEKVMAMASKFLVNDTQALSPENNNSLVPTSLGIVFRKAYLYRQVINQDLYQQQKHRYQELTDWYKQKLEQEQVATSSLLASQTGDLYSVQTNYNDPCNVHYHYDQDHPFNHELYDYLEQVKIKTAQISLRKPNPEFAQFSQFEHMPYVYLGAFKTLSTTAQELQKLVTPIKNENLKEIVQQQQTVQAHKDLIHHHALKPQEYKGVLTSTLSKTLTSAAISKHKELLTTIGLYMGLFQQQLQELEQTILAIFDQQAQANRNNATYMAYTTKEMPWAELLQLSRQLQNNPRSPVSRHKSLIVQARELYCYLRQFCDPLLVPLGNCIVTMEQYIENLREVTVICSKCLAGNESDIATFKSKLSSIINDFTKNNYSSEVILLLDNLAEILENKHFAQDKLDLERLDLEINNKLIRQKFELFAISNLYEELYAHIKIFSYLAQEHDWLSFNQKLYAFVRADIDPDHRKVELHLEDLDASLAFKDLRQKLPAKTWVMTSATLSINQSCDPFINKLGISKFSDSGMVPSPFRHLDQAGIFIANQSGTYRKNDDISPEAFELIIANQGRCLWLCTSKRRVDALAQRLEKELNLEVQKEFEAYINKYELRFPRLKEREDYIEKHGYKVLSQSDNDSKSQMIERLKTENRIVIVATRSFWEGVNVPGHKLSLIIIDKYPHPQLNAYYSVLQNTRSQDKYLSQYYVPDGFIVLKQGIGRLIRSEKDFGLVVILDNRLKTSGGNHYTNLMYNLINQSLAREFPNFQFIPTLSAAKSFLINKHIRYGTEAPTAVDENSALDLPKNQ